MAQDDPRHRGKAEALPGVGCSDLVELSRFAAGSATLLLRATPRLDKASPMSHHPASLQPALRRAYFVQAPEFQRIKKQKAREHFFAVHRARSTPNRIEAPCGQRL